MATRNEIACSECIAFRIDSFDSHKAYDGKNKTYTVQVPGNYVVRVGGEWIEARLTAGDTLRFVEEVMSESCGIFYKSVTDKLDRV